MLAGTGFQIPETIKEFQNAQTLPEYLDIGTTLLGEGLMAGGLVHGLSRAPTKLTKGAADASRIRENEGQLRRQLRPEDAKAAELQPSAGEGRSNLEQPAPQHPVGRYEPSRLRNYR